MEKMKPDEFSNTRHCEEVLRWESLPLPKQSAPITTTLGLLWSQPPAKAIHFLAMTTAFLVVSLISFAQSSIEVIRDPRVDTLISRYTEVHKKKESIDGYRIQVIAGSNRTNVYQVKSQFYKLFPNITQYLIYQAPNFKLRVGNYRTRLEAFRDLEQIAPEFKGAFIISDEIKISEL